LREPAKRSMTEILKQARIPELEMIAEESTFSPEENLRRESRYWKTLERPSARAWRNEACVVLGRFLDAGEETYPRRAEACVIPILWRPSGGGAVFHDPGNINYSIYLQHEGLRSKAEDSLRSLSFPVTALLDNLGVPWEWVPPNNVYVRGKKISGSAQARSRGRLLHHGTLLVDCDLEMMSWLLKAGGRSRTAPVINLKELSPRLTPEEITSMLWRIMETSRSLPVECAC